MPAEDLKQVISDVAAVLVDNEAPPLSKLEALNKLVNISNAVENPTALIPEALRKSLRLHITHSTRRIRTAALRAIRYLTKDLKFMQALLAINVDFCVVRSLERDKNNEPERLQALKLIRRFMELDCSAMPRSIIQSIIGVAEHPDDNFRRVCLETLCEITVRNPQIVALCNGMRTIFNAVIDPAGQDIIDSLVLTILYILNDDNTRCFVRPELELELVLSPFTDAFVQEGPEREMKLGASRTAVVTMMKSWTGIICLSSDDMGLRTLVDALRLPSKETRKTVLSTLFEIFRLSQGQARGSTHISSKGDFNSLNLPPRSTGRHNLLNNYIAAILATFVNCGLIEALVDLGKGSDKTLATRSTTLLGEILYMANTLLPPAQCARLQTLPSLVNHATFFSAEPSQRPVRSRASTMLNNLHQFLRTKKTDSLDYQAMSQTVTGANRFRRLKGLDRSMDRIDDLKSKIDARMDDPTFQMQIKEAMITDVKDHTRWNWAIISELLEGPIPNHQTRMSICLKNKFFKRLLSFYKPEKRLFAALPFKSESVKYVRVMCQVVEVLLNNDEGFEYLKNNELLPQVSNTLKLEVEGGNDSHPGRVLKPEGIRNTMSREYFTLLGTLCSHQRGLELMNKFKIWTYLYPVSELKGREDMTRLMLTCLDYNMEGTHSRILLSKCMRSGSQEIRKQATLHMRTLLRVGVSDFSKWGIDLLVTQLYDPDPDVAQAALSVLDEACDDERSLESLIAKRPSILQMGTAGKNLLLQFLATENGFNYLQSLSILEPEFKEWKDKGLVKYVNDIETALANAMNLAWDHEANTTNVVSTPPHFFGELAKTKAGCEMLAGGDLVPSLVKTVVDTSAKSLNRRSALWALGHIAASNLGFELVHKHDVIPTIVNLAETSPCLSLRGTCFYVLGLASRCEASREQLEALDWESPRDLGSGICVPRDVKKFFHIPDYKYVGSWANEADRLEPPRKTAVEGVQEDVLTAISNLSNHITADGASRQLRRLKAKHAALFTSTEMLFQAFTLMETYKYRLPVRRFIYDQLFDGTSFTEESFDDLAKIRGR